MNGDRRRVEFKTLEQPRIETLRRALRIGAKQAEHVIVDARGVDMSERVAREGIDRLEPADRAVLRFVRIIGRSYDLTFEVRP